MTSSSRHDTLFKYRHFDRRIIILCVRWHLSYKLSYRNLVEMMAESLLTTPFWTHFGHELKRLAPDTKPCSTQHSG